MRVLRLPYALLILWRDRRRFLPAVLAVTFSAVLIAVQCGLLFGLLVCSSVPVDHASADIWITTPDTTAVGQAQPIPRSWLLRVEKQPEVERVETYLLGYGSWHKPGRGNSETCILIGSRLDDDSLGVIQQISPEIRARLTEPGTVVVDEWDLKNLGLSHGADECAEINGRRVRVVGTVRSVPGLNFAWVFASLETARELLPEAPPVDKTSFGLVRCRQPEQAAALAARLRAQYPEMGVYTAAEFSRRVRLYWLVRSKGGTVMLCTVILALLVGSVVTSQTLYGAVLASLREYSVLDALGIPRRRLVGLVLAQSLWIGLAGVTVALPVIYLLSGAALLIRTRVLLWDWLVGATLVLTLSMALLSGVSARRSLRGVEPATLLR